MVTKNPAGRLTGAGILDKSIVSGRGLSANELTIGLPALIMTGGLTGLVCENAFGGIDSFLGLQATRKMSSKLVHNKYPFVVRLFISL
jgi:hypothetical protein